MCTKSALTLQVLEELLLRGGIATQADSSTLQGCSLALQTLPITALDLCGCVSRTFVEAVVQLVARHSLDGRSAIIASPVILPHLKRLGLFDVLISSHLLTTFVSSFPNLAYLDLANTRATPALLATLGNSRSLRLQSLSLSKCQLLDSDSIRNFLIHSTPCVLNNLTELNLYFSARSIMPLSKAHLREILEHSPVFQSGHLRYLDIATAPLDDILLSESFPPQPALLNLGMSNCPQISWRCLRTFLDRKAPSVEVLDICGSCREPLLPELIRTARRDDRLLNTIIGLHQYLIPRSDERAPHSLRVVELDVRTLEAIEESGAHPDWRVFHGKSYRGWYVDCAANNSKKNRRIGGRDSPRRDKDDPARLRLIELALKSRLGSDVGWQPGRWPYRSTVGCVRTFKERSSAAMKLMLTNESEENVACTISIPSSSYSSRH